MDDKLALSSREIFEIAENREKTDLTSGIVIHYSISSTNGRERIVSVFIFDKIHGNCIRFLAFIAPETRNENFIFPSRRAP